MPERRPIYAMVQRLRAAALGTVLAIAAGCSSGQPSPPPPASPTGGFPTVPGAPGGSSPAPLPGQGQPGQGTGPTAPGGAPGSPDETSPPQPLPGSPLAAQPLAPGCGGGPGEADRPAPPGATIAPAWRRGGNTPFPTRQAHRSGCRFAVGGSALLVSLYLPRDAREAEARQALHVAGATPESITWSPEEFALQLQFPEGPNGQAIRLQFQGQPGPTLPILDFQIDLIREFPTVEAAVRHPEEPEWRSLHPWEVQPPGPLELRLTFDRPVSQPEAESRLRRIQSLNQASWEWTSPQTLEIHHPNPPPLLVIDLGGLPGPGGIGLYSPPVVLRTGTSPVAVALQPGTGEAQVLARVPAETERAEVGAGGRWLAVTATLPSAAPPWTLEQSWAINLQTGLWRTAPFSGGFLGWRHDQALLGPGPSGTIVSWEPETDARLIYSVSPDVRYLSLSPDGRYLAGVRLHEDRLEPERQVMPVDLALLDLNTGREQIRRGWARYWPGPGQWAAPLPLAWTQDGSGVVSRTYLGPDLWDWVILNLQTGEARILPAHEAGSLTLAGQHLTGPAGQVLRQNSPWGSVLLQDPRGTSLDLGPGFPAGWLPDGRALLLRLRQEAGAGATP